MKLRHTLIAAAAAGLSGVAAPALAAQDTLTVKCGKLITAPGKEIDKAVILIENGKIKAVGADVKIPWESKVIDASDKVVMATYVVAHTSSGMSSGNERMANVPYLTVQDGVDPASQFFESALRNGVGTVHVIPGNSTLLGGTGMIVKPFGKTVEEMAVRARTGLKMSLAATSGSRMAQIHKMRRALKDIADYLEGYERRKKEFEAEKAAGATKDKEFKEKIDEKKKPVVDLLQGKARAYFYIPSTAELFEGIRLVDRYKLDVVFVLGPECHKSVDMLAKAKIPVILDAQMEYEVRDRKTDEDVSYCPAAMLSKAGKAYALSVGSGMTQYPWWQMATAIRNGASREDALAAMTTVPAEILGVADEVGSIEVGKTANLQILSGDPLKATTWVESVVLDGEVVYERSTDRRLQHLFGNAESKDSNNR